MIQQNINLVETRFNAKVIFIRSNEEKSLENDFVRFIHSKEISFESSTSDSSKQNDHFERKRGILIMKTRAMRIDAGLPMHLWPEIFRAAGYIANRTPMKKHEWKTPYQLVLGQAPDLSHLHRYECKAYTLNKHIPRKLKLQKRAHIEHLIEYEARNIFRV